MGYDALSAKNNGDELSQALRSDNNQQAQVSNIATDAQSSKHQTTNGQRHSMVPFEQYARLMRDFQAAQQHLQAMLKQQQHSSTGKPQQPQGLQALSPETIQQRLSADPISLMREVVAEEAEKHLIEMKEMAELQGALRNARKIHPEFRQFEPFILREVAELIANDPDGVIDPWNELLEKGFYRFQEKFQQAVMDNPELVQSLHSASSALPAAGAEARQLEPAGSRQATAQPPRFSREEIARMSLQEFEAQEAAINEALRQNRIR